MADAYRDPDLRERVCELEAECAPGCARSAPRSGRGAAGRGAVGRGIDVVWDWLWEGPIFILAVLAVAGVVGYTTYEHAQPKAEATVDINGRPSFVLNCAGTDCALLAGRSCPHGYEVTKEMPDGLLIVCKEERK